MTPAWSARLALAALTIAAAGFVGWHTPSGFPLDDAWIHQVVARHAAGGPGFAPGGSAGGSTSALWTWLLAPAHLIGLSDPVTYTRGLSLLLWIAAVQAVYGLSRTDGWSEFESFAIGGGAAVSGQAVWYAWSGMEAILVIATSVAAILAWQRNRPILRDVSLVALALSRPEGAALGVVLAAFETRWRTRVRVVAVPALAFLLAATWSWHLTGTAMPATFAGRRWLYGLDQGIRPLDLAYFVAQWLHSLWYYTLQRSTVLGVMTIVGTGLGLAALWKRRAHGWMALLAWTMTMLVIYLVMLPRSGHAGRYQALVPIVLLPLTAMGALFAGEVFGKSQRAALALCLVVIVGAPSLMAWRVILHGGIAHIEGTHRSLGRWAGAHLRPDARVAAFDMGAIAWELPGRVVDLSALSSGNLAYLRERRTADLLRDERADYVMLPLPPPGTVDGTRRFNLGPDRIALHEVQRRQTPIDQWQLSFDATAHAWAGQALYRIDTPAAETTGR